MKKISVITVVRNEKDNIRPCLETVKWAHEIIVIDQGSEDDTAAIAKEFTDKVYTVEQKGYCEPDRIFALSKASGEWILCIDADERIPEQLAQEIKNVLSADYINADGYYILRNNYIFGRLMKYGGHQGDKHLRLFKKDKVRLSEKIHEAPSVEGATGQLKNSMDHYSTRTLSDYCRKLNSYTDREMERMDEEGRKFSVLTIMIRPAGKFLDQYILKQGFRDGMEGFIFYSLSAFYTFIKYVKLWEKKKPA